MTTRITGPARQQLIAQLAARYQAGETIRQLAESVGFSYAAVHAMLHASGVVVRPRYCQSALRPLPLPQLLAVGCPKCRARVGERCRRPNHGRVAGQPHTARIREASR